MTEVITGEEFSSGSSESKILTPLKEIDDNSIIELGKETDDKSKQKKQRRRRKKHSEDSTKDDNQSVGNTIHQHISILQDDVITVNDQPLSCQNLLQANIHSSSNGKLFVEHARGNFKAIDQTKLEKLELENSLKNSKAENKVDSGSLVVLMCLRMHKRQQKVGKCCQGLFAGFATCHLIIVYCLGPPNFAFPDWFSHYSKLATPIEAVFYLLSVICLWTLLSRCDIGGEEGSIWKQIKQFNIALLAAVIYLVVLILSLTIAKVDESNRVKKYDVPLEESFIDIVKWRNMNLYRCLGAILAWIFLCISHPCDYNRKFLENIYKGTAVSKISKSEC